MFKRMALVASVFATALLISSCGGGSSSGVVSVTGYWSGTWTSSTGQSGALTTTLTSNASTYSGPATIYNSNCFGYEFATGTLDGSKLTLGVASNAIIFVGTVSGSTISGLYNIYSGGCSGDSGTFSISK